MRGQAAEHTLTKAHSRSIVGAAVGCAAWAADRRAVALDRADGHAVAGAAAALRPAADCDVHLPGRPDAPPRTARAIHDGVATLTLLSRGTVSSQNTLAAGGAESA